MSSHYSHLIPSIYFGFNYPLGVSCLLRDENQACFDEPFPKEILTTIFQKTIEDLPIQARDHFNQISLVSKRWKQLIDECMMNINLDALFPGVIFRRKNLESFGFQTIQELAISSNRRYFNPLDCLLPVFFNKPKEPLEQLKFNQAHIFKVLTSFCPFSGEKKRIYETHFLVELTEDFVLNTLKHIKYTHQGISKNYGEKKYGKHAFYLVSKEPLKQCVEKKYEESVRLIEEMNYEVADLHTSVIFALARLSQNRQQDTLNFMNEEISYAICKDQFHDYQIAVKLDRTDSQHVMIELDYDNQDRRRTVLALKKL